MRALVRLAALALPCICLAQSELIGPGRYPQFRGISGLPGSVVPVRPDGSTGPGGALSYSTPIAYGLAHGVVVAGISYMNDSHSLAFFEGAETADGLAGNGTAVVVLGLAREGWGRLSSGYMLLSSYGDGAFNFLYQPPGGEGRFAWAVGLQDLSGGGGTRGTGPGNSDPGWSRSLFLVATTEWSPGFHTSLGLGTKRFNGGFGSASYHFGRVWTATVEYDTYGWNWGLQLDLGRMMVVPGQGREARGTVTVNRVMNRYLAWTVGFSL